VLELMANGSRLERAGEESSGSQVEGHIRGAMAYSRRVKSLRLAGRVVAGGHFARRIGMSLTPCLDRSPGGVVFHGGGYRVPRKRIPVDAAFNSRPWKPMLPFRMTERGGTPAVLAAVLRNPYLMPLLKLNPTREAGRHTARPMACSSWDAGCHPSPACIDRGASGIHSNRLSMVSQFGGGTRMQPCFRAPRAPATWMSLPAQSQRKAATAAASRLKPSVRSSIDRA
jgi:hypothetical protein